MCAGAGFTYEYRTTGSLQQNSTHTGGTGQTWAVWSPTVLPRWARESRARLRPLLRHSLPTPGDTNNNQSYWNKFALVCTVHSTARCAHYIAVFAFGEWRIANEIYRGAPKTMTSPPAAWGTVGDKGWCLGLKTCAISSCRDNIIDMRTLALRIRQGWMY